MTAIRTQVTIVEKLQETPQVLTIRLKPKDKINFKPGQFLMLAFLEDSKLTRSYSIASSPTRELIDVTFKVVGAFTKKLKTAPVGTTLNCTAPLGRFTFNETTDKHLVLIAGGIGVTPLRGMLQYALDKKLDAKITLLLSCQTSNAIPYKKELLKLQANPPKNVKIYITITREDANWQGPHGRLNAEVVKKLVDSPNDAVYFICGLNAMVDAIASILNELNIDKNKVKMEKWG